MIKPEDIIISTFRSVHQGKRNIGSLDEDIGVSVYHKPSDIGVSCDKYGSVHKNRAECMIMLEEELCWLYL